MLKKLKRIIKDFQRWKARHRAFSWPSYGKWVEEIKQDKSHFVPFTDTPYQRKEGDVKIFAYYLTQFHAIPENDKYCQKDDKKAHDLTKISSLILDYLMK